MTASEPPPATGWSAPDPAALRIGDTERNAAVSALGEHMSTGRLDLDEFGTRSAKASSARTVGELRQLFADLPAPHPPLPGVGPSQPGPGPQAPSTGMVRPAAGLIQPVVGATPALPDDRSKAQKIVAAAAGSAGIIAVVLFFTTGAWWWFLLIPLISSVAGGIWGDSWKRPDHRG
jgi:hypothetical protein